MLVIRQDARKLDFPGKFDAVWLGPYLIRKKFCVLPLRVAKYVSPKIVLTWVLTLTMEWGNEKAIGKRLTPPLEKGKLT